MKMVMEKSWKIDQKSWNCIFTHGILPILPQNCIIFVCIFSTTKNLSIDVKSQHFLKFSRKHRKCKIAKRDGHGKLSNGHGKVMETFCQVCGSPEA